MKFINRYKSYIANFIKIKAKIDIYNFFKKFVQFYNKKLSLIKYYIKMFIL